MTSSGKLQVLQERLGLLSSLVVAYSGGADSAFLAVVANGVLGAKAIAVTGISASLSSREHQAAREFARAHGISHIEVLTAEGDRPEYRANDGQRCFQCKSALFEAIRPISDLLGAAVAVGTNTDDLDDYRPGQRAASEQGVITPLVDAELSKREIRELSLALGLETAEKPAAACLASRVAYGDPVTPAVLAMVEKAEDGLADLGIPVVRVRSHANGTVARIEVPQGGFDQIVKNRARVDQIAKDAGFTFCSLDLLAYKSGRLNQLIQIGEPHS